MQRSRVAGLTLYDFAEGTPLLPDGHLRHQVRAWLNFEQTWVDGIISRARFRRTFPDVVPTHPMLFDIWTEEGQRALQTLDAHLASREFMVSDRFGLAWVTARAQSVTPSTGRSSKGWPQRNQAAAGAPAWNRTSRLYPRSSR